MQRKARSLAVIAAGSSSMDVPSLGVAKPYRVIEDRC
jgi:hypothetical protein